LGAPKEGLPPIAGGGTPAKEPPAKDEEEDAPQFPLLAAILTILGGLLLYGLFSWLLSSNQESKKERK
jgi:hypothetical protein